VAADLAVRLVCQVSSDDPVFHVFAPRPLKVVGGERVGVLHAASAAEDETTLCGLPVTALMELANHIFSDTRESLRCEKCNEVLKGCS
jgi:hypothetical protein